ncbi:MAG: phage portal protein [Alphaproteobacteria bacterium]|nr:phage portal protein [Alphaproteobacteria bacterium]MBL1418882.1 phage portal protein [Alphaproteobacteria bacterium]
MSDFLGEFGLGAGLTPTRAMQHTAVAACVRLLSQMISTVPIQIIDTSDDSVVDDHELHYLFDRAPNDLLSAPEFWEQVIRDMLLEGDGFFYIDRNKSGEVLGFERYAPSSVEIKYSDKGKKKLIYKLIERDGRFKIAPQDDVVHLRYIGSNGYMGDTPIQFAAGTINAGLTENEFSDKYYTKGGTLGYVVSYAEKIAQETKDDFYQRFKENNTGMNGAGSALILDQGGKMDALKISAADAQIIEAMKWRVTDIARAYGVFPFLIGESEKQTAFGKSVAEQFRAFVNTTLRPLAVKVQGATSNKVFGRRSRYVMRFDLDVLLVGDIEARATYYSAALGGNQMAGYMTPNEIRKKEKLKPMPDEQSNQLYRPLTADNNDIESEIDEK